MRSLTISLLIWLVWTCPVLGTDMLNLIPAAALEELPQNEENPKTSKHNRSLELVASAISYREAADLELPPPTDNSPDWGLLTRLNLQGQNIHHNLSWHWNARLEMSRQDDQDFQWNKSNQLYLKELYLSYATQTCFLDIGRINLRYGVASGFNPTDYYRGGAAINDNNVDAGRQREDRLGTIAIRISKLWRNLSASLVFSPDLHAEQHDLLADQDVIGLQLPQTNYQTRATASLSWQTQHGLFAEGLFHVVESTPSLGLNLSYSLGQSWLLHLENSVSRRQSLVAESAISNESNSAKSWHHQSALGATWTSATNISLTTEIHYNQAGMTESDWDDWFYNSDQAATNPALAGKLWSVRQLARDQQEPLSRWQLYLRASWGDALIPDLTLTNVTMLSPTDGSFLTQIESSYPYNERLVLTTRVIINVGSKQSEHGSTSNHMVSLCQLEYYF